MRIARNYVNNIFSVSLATSDFVSFQIDAMLGSKDAEKYLDKDLFLYLAIVGLLTYSGKDTTAEAILNVAHAINRIVRDGCRKWLTKVRKKTLHLQIPCLQITLLDLKNATAAPAVL